MSMEPHVKCDYDYVELRDGDNENATLISKFCGSTAPSRYFKSSGNTMFIRFFSDASITHNIGFFGVVSATLGNGYNEQYECAKNCHFFFFIQSYRTKFKLRRRY